MRLSKKMSLDVMSSWNKDFQREFELVIASNVFNSMTTNTILYDADLNERVSWYCQKYDTELVDHFDGVIHVDTNDSIPSYEFGDKELKALSSKQRGSWAIFEMNGFYDAFMSDGYGGIGTESGHKFQRTSPKSYENYFNTLYGATLSYPIFKKRHEIESEIYSFSAKSNPIQIGDVSKNVTINRKNYSKIEYIQNIESTGKHEIKASRRGAKPDLFHISDDTLVRLFKIPIFLPEKYIDEKNDIRLHTPFERKLTHANEAIKNFMSDLNGSDIIDSTRHIYWKQNGNEFLAELYPHENRSVPCADVIVYFKPNTEEILEIEFNWKNGYETSHSYSPV